jgi:hypothetical protein
MPLLHPILVRGFLPTSFKTELAVHTLMEKSDLGVPLSLTIRTLKDGQRGIQMHIQLNETLRNKFMFRNEMFVGQVLTVKDPQFALLKLKIFQNPNYHDDMYWNTLTKETATRVALACLQ